MLFICMALIDDEEDQKSFAELYNKYETMAISIALKILKSREAAEDACSEAFLGIAKCYERIKNLEPQELERYIVVTVKDEAGSSEIRGSGSFVRSLFSLSPVLKDKCIWVFIQI